VADFCGPQPAIGLSLRAALRVDWRPARRGPRPAREAHGPSVPVSLAAGRRIRTNGRLPISLGQNDPRSVPIILAPIFPKNVTLSVRSMAAAGRRPLSTHARRAAGNGVHASAVSRRPSPSSPLPLPFSSSFAQRRTGAEAQHLCPVGRRAPPCPRRQGAEEW
jgi:hypothetical protein